MLKVGWSKQKHEKKAGRALNVTTVNELLFEVSVS
jgi:hypothetical protein